MTEPLHIPGVATRGPGGRRNTLSRLRDVLVATRPSVLVMDVTHDDGCPCHQGSVAVERCTCLTVDVTLYVAHGSMS